MGNWLYYITGGRPMRREEYAFTDTVSGKFVGYYIDGFGRRWLAEGPWSFFRVLSNNQDPRHDR